MPFERNDVTQKSDEEVIEMPQGVELPGWASSYVVFVKFLQAQGIWQDIDQHLRINRQGYQGIDLVMVLLAYQASHFKGGLKEFLEDSRPFGALLAAVAGRQDWPTQSSMSRALNDVDIEEVNEFSSWWWTKMAEMGRFLLAHPAAMYRDGQQTSVRVFHGDGTVHAIRQRALPEGDSLPPAKRLVTRLAIPGYSGRKRGEVVYTVTAMQEAGTSLWTAASLSSGSGQLPQQIAHLTQVSQEWVAILEDDPQKAMVITDGEGGGRGQAVVGANSEMGFATRLSCYELLGEPEIVEHLNQTTWTQVDDSCSGPKRWAADLGTIRLRDVELRVVVSRWANSDGKKRGSGRVIGQWQYDLFGLDKASLDFLTPSQAVEVYYGRNGIENSFAMKNREFSPPRILAFSPGGQLLATVMELSAWNLETILGAALEAPLADVVSDALPKDAQPKVAPDSVELPAANHPPKAHVQVSQELIDQLIETYDWETRLGDDWHYDGNNQQLICQANLPLQLQAVRVTYERVELRFRGSYTGCSTCPFRQACSRSKATRFRREVGISVKVDPQEIVSSTIYHDWKPPAAKPIEAPTQLEKPRFVPGEFRRAYRRSLKTAFITVALGNEQPQESTPLYLVRTAVERQRRRQTWTQRSDWNKARREVDVHISTPTNTGLKERLDRLLAPAASEADVRTPEAIG